ncbi:MAG: hypothetical protein IPJ65_22445 [Archangiaceae bacterium]|nr:hypothetical protein [Archangiaceae bacterium]
MPRYARVGQLKVHARALAAVGALALAGFGCAPPAVSFEGKTCGAADLCPAPLQCLETPDGGASCRENPAALGPARAEFSDDFESGHLLGTETPAGAWQAMSGATPNTLTLTSAAAHRGAFGLRSHDEDAAAASGYGHAVKRATAARDGDLYLRLWLRRSALTATGSIIPLWVIGAPFVPPGANQLLLISPTGELECLGFDARGMNSSTRATVTLRPDWHLVEVATLGMGTSRGERVLWLDGVELTRKSLIDWSGGSFREVALGEPWANDAAWVGDLDFDDVRWGAAPLASKLALDVSGVGATSGCAPLAVRLLDSSGQAAPADDDTPVALTLGGAPLTVYSDRECAAELDAPALPRGASGRWFFWRETGIEAQLRAESADFLPAAAATGGSGG